MKIIISAAFSNPYLAFRAREALQSSGILCKHQLGRRVAHFPTVPKEPPHHSHGCRVHAHPADTVVHHPVAVLNLLSAQEDLPLVRQILRKFHGREI